MPVLEVEALRTTIFGERTIWPVDGVTLSIDEGETVCLVGESGSGKSMTALTIMRLLELEADARIEGSVRFRGRELLSLSQRAMRDVRGRGIGMVFQEPMTALNPVLRVGRQLLQVRQYHRSSRVGSRKWRGEARTEVVATLRAVGIAEPEAMLRQYPHQLSGGMLQRVVIAMALLGEPALLIADEPTTALDVTTQAQILELLADLQGRTGMAMLLITHDMGVAAEVATRVAVMYAGQLVEDSDAASLFERPSHPYTKGLLASVPMMGARPRQRLSSIPGSVPSLSDLPPACRFAPRCAYATEQCRRTAPVFRQLDPARKVACWHAEDLLVRS